DRIGVSGLGPLVWSVFLYSSGPPRQLHSFPTRRSSDLPRRFRQIISRRNSFRHGWRSLAGYHLSAKFAHKDHARHFCFGRRKNRSEEHTSELQSLRHLVCRLLLEKKNMKSVRLRPRAIP